MTGTSIQPNRLRTRLSRNLLRTIGAIPYDIKTLLTMNIYLLTLRQYIQSTLRRRNPNVKSTRTLQPHLRINRSFNSQTAHRLSLTNNATTQTYSVTRLVIGTLRMNHRSIKNQRTRIVGLKPRVSQGHILRRLSKITTTKLRLIRTT